MDGNTIFFNKIVSESYVDGPGKRSVAFLQGCPIGCPGCQNKSLWNIAYGLKTAPAGLARSMRVLSPGIELATISGGEPFFQPYALVSLLRCLRSEGFNHIIVYTGYTWDNLLDPLSGECLIALSAMQLIDVLVDGPFISQRDDNLISWRGSRNQRPINVQKSLQGFKLGDPVPVPILENWDNPNLSIASDGTIYLPVGLAGAFNHVGPGQETRMCGQTKEVKNE
jgi:anaerobic ribonucleoside-triphosphate reductase activating protein